jgi:hypothetical protein
MSPGHEQPTSPTSSAMPPELTTACVQAVRDCRSNRATDCRYDAAKHECGRCQRPTDCRSNRATDCRYDAAKHERGRCQRPTDCRSNAGQSRSSRARRTESTRMHPSGDRPAEDATATYSPKQHTRRPITAPYALREATQDEDEGRLSRTTACVRTVGGDGRSNRVTDCRYDAAEQERGDARGRPIVAPTLDRTRRRGTAGPSRRRMHPSGDRPAEDATATYSPKQRTPPPHHCALRPSRGDA